MVEAEQGLSPYLVCVCILHQRTVRRFNDEDARFGPARSDDSSGRGPPQRHHHHLDIGAPAQMPVMNLKQEESAMTSSTGPPNEFPFYFHDPPGFPKTRRA